MRKFKPKIDLSSPFLLVWLVGWSAGTLFFDSMACSMIMHQVRALSYDTAVGVVTRSEVASSSDSDGASYWHDLEYSYEVAGVEHRGTIYRHGFDMNDRRQVRETVAAHPVGSEAQVYYNPADPADALLKPGLQAMDFFLPLFLVPFNIIMVGMFCGTIGAWVWRLIGMKPLSISIRSDNVKMSACIYQTMRVTAAGLAALAIAFVEAFVVGFGMLLVPGWLLILPAWVVLVVGTCWAYLVTRPSGTLVIDEYYQQLSWDTGDGTEPVQIAAAAIESTEWLDSGVVVNGSAASDAAHLSLQIPCASQAAAAWLCDWIRERIGTTE